VKQLITFVLIALFSFYQLGYYFIYFSSQQRLENAWIDKIFQDNDGFQNQKMLEIPISLPYYTDQEDFQDANTSFEKDGYYYRAIKQRYMKDTLQIIYVPDDAKNQLNQSIISWVKTLVQKEFPNEGGNPITWKYFDKIISNELLNLSFEIILTQKIKPCISSTNTLETFLPIDYPPPIIAS